VSRSLEPLPQLFAAPEIEFGQRVGNVVLHRVDADAAALRDLTSAQTMSHRVDRAPFRGRQHIVVLRATRPAASPAFGFLHGSNPSARSMEFPYPPVNQALHMLDSVKYMAHDSEHDVVLSLGSGATLDSG
jgi:hypothetical protein